MYVNSNDRDMKLGRLICSVVLMGLALPVFAQTATEPTRFVHVNRDKEAVKQLYQTIYLPARDFAEGWKDLGNCNPGSLSAATLKARTAEINYFRKMAGLHAITLDPEMNKKAQAAAFLMLQNGTLNHYPPKTWKCYSELAAAGAGSSNLGYGQGLMTYMEDFGSNNQDCGHRMWILKSQTKTFGYGGTNSTTAICVLGPTAMYDSLPKYVAWPPAGFVPTEILTNRWTFSVPGETVDFADATVQLSLNGSAIPLVYHKATSYGDGGMSFEIDNWSDWGPKMRDQKVKVVIKNVIINDEARSFTYEVAPFEAEDRVAYGTNGGEREITYSNDATGETKATELEEVADLPFSERKLMSLGELVEPSELPNLTVEQLRASAVRDLVFNAAFCKFATQVSNYRKAKNPDPVKLNEWAAAKIKAYLARQSELDEDQALAAQTPKFLLLEVRKMIPINGQESFGDIATELAQKFAEKPELKAFALKYKRIRQCGMGLAIKRVDRNGQTYAGVYATLVVAPAKLVMGS